MSGDKAGRAGRRWTRGDQAWVRDHSERNGRSRKGRRKYGACPPGRVSVPKARAASRPTSAQMNQNRSRARDHQRYQGLDEVVGDWHACTQTQATPNRQSGRFEVPARLAGDEVSIEGPTGKGGSSPSRRADIASRASSQPTIALLRRERTRPVVGSLGVTTRSRTG